MHNVGMYISELQNEAARGVAGREMKDDGRRDVYQREIVLRVEGVARGMQSPTRRRRMTAMPPLV